MNPNIWTGEPFSYTGKNYTLEVVAFLPKPVKGKILIWVGGQYPNLGPIKRAAKYDGMIPLPELANGEYTSLEDYQEIYNKIISYRGNKNFDFVIITMLPPPNDNSDPKFISFIKGGIESGFTWLINYIDPFEKLEAIEKRIRQGPPEF